eukprot:TRINITY_DN59253_c0_g1_i2.p1 TRINITY_DN59253_c0_g1~~TRINITY_DN59253_c0_g1_i2.p1  ORF type:complete len:200 (+),score=15.18 TRINITY_DN59253_c0_g1_i2:99-698(+)
MRTASFLPLSILVFVTLLLLQLARDVHPNQGPVDEHVIDGLSIIHVNVRSLRHKMYLLQCEVSPYDIVTLSETWLSDDIHNDDILIQGFHPPVRNDRRGVAVYVRNNVVCKPRPDLCVPFLEAVWIETKIEQDILLIGTFYRPPDANVAYWDLIDQSVQLAGNTPDKFIVLGDFNADCTHQLPTHLCNIMTTNSLSQDS